MATPANPLKRTYTNQFLKNKDIEDLSNANAQMVEAVNLNTGFRETFDETDTPNDGDLWTWDAATGKYLNEPPTGVLTDKYVEVTSADTTPGNLSTKLLAGSGISLTVGSPAGNETLTIANTDDGSSAVGTHESTYDHTKLHDAVTVTDGATIDFTLTGQDITAEVKTDSINDTHIDWGTGTNQVSLDNVPDGVTSKINQDVRDDGSPQFVALSINTTLNPDRKFQYKSDRVEDGGTSPLLERTSHATDIFHTGVNLMHSTDGDMIDGFGVCQSMAIKDSAGVENVIVQVVAQRDGADDSGKVSFRPYASGIANERMALKSNGTVYFLPDSTSNVGIGTTAPHTKFDVRGGISTLVGLFTSSSPTPGNYHINVMNGSSTSDKFGQVPQLPTVVGIAGREYIFTKNHASGGGVLILPASGETINGMAADVPYRLINHDETVTLRSDGVSNWVVVNPTSTVKNLNVIDSETYTELYANYHFTSDPSAEWTLTNSASPDITWDSSTLMTVTNDTTSNRYIYQAFTTVVGKTYIFESKINSLTTGKIRFKIGNAANTDTFFTTTANTSGTRTFSFVATATTTYITVYLLAGSIGDNVVFDYISLKEITGGNITANGYLQSGTTGFKTVDSTGAVVVGATGAFTTADTPAKTVTVNNGIITSIV